MSATPLAGLVPWLEPLVRNLRASVANENATNEERELLSLIEFVGSRFGDSLLQAGSEDELDDRLDDLVRSPEALYCTVLLVRLLPLVQVSEPVSAEGFADDVSEHLGAEQGAVLTAARDTLDAWLGAQRQAAAILLTHPANPSDEAERVFSFSLASPEIPAEFAELVFHSLRATFCSVAIVQAISAERAIDSWLVGALVARLVSSAKEHLRLLASLPGVHVDEAIVPAARRLDLVGMDARHRQARATALRSLQETRTRLGL